MPLYISNPDVDIRCISGPFDTSTGPVVHVWPRPDASWIRLYASDATNRSPGPPPANEWFGSVALTKLGPAPPSCRISCSMRCIDFVLSMSCSI